MIPIEPDWKAIECDLAAAGLTQLLSGVQSALSDAFGGSEERLVQEILFQIDAGVIPEAYGWPPILTIEKEFPVPRGRIDLLLFHSDGSATAIECKATADPREVLPAIGQVMGYGVFLGYSRTLTKVRLAVASRATGAALRPYAPVFRQCGVEPVYAGMHRKQALAFVSDLLHADPLQLKA